jgi:DAK2 domain fusion protein YloV
MTTIPDRPHQALAEWDGTHWLDALRAAERWLDQHVPVINALNVFPVPDGDTGTNMHLTLAAAVRDAQPLPSCAAVAARVYERALKGSRGNSGVILSQILRGMSRGLAEQNMCGPAELAAALVQGSLTAYRGASEPREGTILTVSREAGEAAQAALDGPDATLVGVLAAAVVGAQASVARTPELLEVLRHAGVVDAGGEGYAVILEGMLRWATGASLVWEEQPAGEQQFVATVEDLGHEGYGFCTNVLLRGVGMPFEAIRTHITGAGESAVVVGDEALIRIHVHTPRPGDILNFVGDHGTIEQVEITNMDLQREAIKEQQAAAAKSMPGSVPPAVQYLRDAAHRNQIGTVVVAPGAGFTKLFLSMNADAVVIGGQTMNPSTQDILEAIEALPQQQVLVLPNNGNIIGAARQAQALTQKQVQVVPTRTMPQGVAAMLGRNYQLPFEQYVEVMTAASSAVVTAEITTAVRDATVDGVQVRQGQTIALLDNQLVAAGDEKDTVIDTILDRMALDECEVLTIYYGQHMGEEQTQALAARIGERYTELEIEIKSGGQPYYDYIIGAE